MAAVRLSLAVISIAITGCAGAQSNFDVLMDTVERRDACIVAFEQDLGGLQQQFSVIDIRTFIAELLVALPPEIREAFTQAAAVAKDDIRANTHDDGDKHALMLRLREVTRQEFAVAHYPAIDNCGSAAVDIVPNIIYRLQKLDRAPMVEQFESIGLTDSFWIEQAVLLMLTLEASGTEWCPQWFSDIAALPAASTVTDRHRSSAY
ncbi:MAG TPA: hypothetical protein PKD55_22035 [Bellilinea sp.]|jgi:hypothetical protein|nr:hypothetical protein [Bellilinea sp.]